MQSRPSHHAMILALVNRRPYRIRFRPGTATTAMPSTVALHTEETPMQEMQKTVNLLRIRNAACLVDRCAGRTMQHILSHSPRIRLSRHPRLLPDRQFNIRTVVWRLS
jgi:hypothetical protein